jgi:DNA-binding transcriptional ArsR family regulator
MEIFEQGQYTDKQVIIAKFAKALSHPARVFILERLSQLNGCCTSGEMIGDIPIARSTLSQHLKELKYSGLIQGEIKPPYIKYCIDKKNWEIAKAMMSDLFEEEDFSRKDLPACESAK